MEKLGGTVSVTTTPGEGSTFKLEIPNMAQPLTLADGTLKVYTKPKISKYKAA